MENKRDLVNYLEHNGVETRDMLPLTNQPFYQDLLGLKESDFPIAQWINNNGFYIACHQNLSMDEKQYIVDVIGSYFKQSQVTKEKSALILMSNGHSRSAQVMWDTLANQSFDERILVEAGSNTESHDFFRSKGFKILNSKGGKGDSLKLAVENTDCEHLIVMGTDGCDNPEDIPRLQVLLRQGFDLAIASRLMSGGQRSAKRRLSLGSFGNRVFSMFTSSLFDENVTDVNNLFRGFRRSSFQALKLRESGEAIMFEMTMRMLQDGQRVTETPTHERVAIQEGQRRNRWATGLKFLSIMLKMLVGTRRQSLQSRRRQLLGQNSKATSTSASKSVKKAS